LLKDKRIVVIEDEVVFRFQLVSFLRQRGATVIEACNGLEGLARIEEFAPDVVLCDLRMPDLDGLQVISKACEVYPLLPVIVISGQGSMVDVSEALRLGALDYLTKPLADMAVLEQTICDCIDYQDGKSAQEDDDQWQLATEELADHITHFRRHDPAATRLLENLQVSSPQELGGFYFEFDSGGGFLLCDVGLARQNCLVIILADLSIMADDAAMGAALIKSFLNQPFRKFHQGEDQLLVDPAAMLSWLNQQLYAARMGCCVPLVYLVMDGQQQQLLYANAGFVGVPVEMESASAGLPLGLLGNISYENIQLSLPLRIEWMLNCPTDNHARLLVEQIRR
jgi:CheY-like chemotaxis protein